MMKKVATRDRREMGTEKEVGGILQWTLDN